jgi:RimJ/RimL family protein N-acetyltransferase
MFELDASQFQQVIPLFAPIEHSIAIVFSVLEGNSPGRVFVDQPDQPSCAFLFPTGAFYYIAGDEKNDAFCHSVRHLLFDILLPEADEKEIILFAFNDAWRDCLDELLKENGAIRIQRKMFDFNPDRYAEFCKQRKGIPAGMRLQPIDSKMAERYPQYQALVDPISKRFGYCLVNGDEIVSECSAIFVGNGEAEIDIHTAEAYQGRGYGLVVASAFIDGCLAKGLRPNWACWPERLASLALAKKLGFAEKPDVDAHLWAEEM